MDISQIFLLIRGVDAVKISVLLALIYGFYELYRYLFKRIDPICKLINSEYSPYGPKEGGQREKVKITAKLSFLNRGIEQTTVKEILWGGGKNHFQNVGFRTRFTYSW